MAAPARKATRTAGKQLGEPDGSTPPCHFCHSLYIFMPETSSEMR